MSGSCLAHQKLIKMKSMDHGSIHIMYEPMSQTLKGGVS